MPRAGETVVAALSGGPDSVALLDALAEAAARDGFRVVAAHLDHALRPDSGADARFCLELCRRLGVALRTGVADVRGRARRERGGIEEAAREERYAFLRRVMSEQKAVVIAVAHTRDDQAETLLLRLLRGAGSAGLGAMRPRSGDLIRPLLSVSREQVLAHLVARGLPFREDPTNADTRILRNRVRHELLPLLEARFNPNVRQTLARAAGLLRDESEALSGLADAVLAAVARHERGGIALERAALARAPKAVARLALRRALEQAGGLRGVGALHIERLLRLAAAPGSSGRRLPLPGGREAAVQFDRLRLGPKAAPARAFSSLLPVPGRVTLPDGGALLARTTRGPVRADAKSAVVRAEGPLMVRTRRPGDRVAARGRERSLRRFLMERRVPADERGRLPLVAAGNRVLFIPGVPFEAASGAGRLVRLEYRAEASA